jgi:hypothetical protein
MSTEIGVEKCQARGGGPSGTTNGLSGWRTEIECRADGKKGAACRLTSVITAFGPRSERRSAAAGSAVLRHEQSDFDRALERLEAAVLSAGFDNSIGGCQVDRYA